MREDTQIPDSEVIVSLGVAANQAIGNESGRSLARTTTSRMRLGGTTTDILDAHRNNHHQNLPQSEDKDKTLL